MLKTKSPAAFRMSMEQKLNGLAKEKGSSLSRLRKQVAFERLLARIFYDQQSDFVLKGGYALTMRFDSSRETKDIDLTPSSAETDTFIDKEAIFEKLVSFSNIDLFDYFTFQIGSPKQELESPPGGGLRFSVKSFIAARLFEQFQLDVGSGIILSNVESIEGSKWLESYGITAPIIPAISQEQQFAEKLHAYTFPRSNTRVKDLVDLALLIQKGAVDSEQLAHAIEMIFQYRNTHPIPKTLLPPPESWKQKYEKMAKQCGINDDIREGFNSVLSFVSYAIEKHLR